MGFGGTVVPAPLINRVPLDAALFWTTVVVWVAGEVRQSQRHRSDAAEHDRGSRRLLRITIVVGWIIAVQAVRRFPGADVGRARVGVFSIGMALMWAGVGLRFWAFRALGRYFTFTVMTSPDQSVITAGPYRFLRHPGYAGGALAMAGVGLVMGNWVSLAAIVVVPLVGTINRIRVEEAALLETLGSDYRSFATSRKRLVPFVW